MSKTILVKKYDTLEECFMAFMYWDKMPDDVNKAYWAGHDGSRPYRKNVGKWLKNPPSCWAWAEYATKSIHVWLSDNVDKAQLIGLIVHELAHLRKPRYKDKVLEEKKAVVCGKDAVTAYGIMNDLLFPTQEARCSNSAKGGLGEALTGKISPPLIFQGGSCVQEQV